MTSKKQVVIEVQGGVVQDVYCSGDIRVILVDWDDCEKPTDLCAGEMRPFPIEMMPVETEEQVSRIK